jgi:hypothetical protein
VGARCRDCAGVSRVPTYNISPVLLLRGFGAAVGSGLVIGAAWGYMLGGIGGFGFFSFFIGLAIGWAISEAISVSTNRRMGPPLAAMGVLAAVICYLTRNAVLDFPLLPAGDVGGYIAVGVAAFFAASRLNR